MEHVTKAFEALYAEAAVVIARGDEWEPMLLAYTNDGRKGPGFSLRNYPNEDWAGLLRAAYLLVGKQGFTVLTSEAWVTTKSSLEDIKVMPSRDPERKEAILFNFLGSDWQAIATCIINRTHSKLEPGKLGFIGKEITEAGGDQIVHSGKPS